MGKKDSNPHEATTRRPDWLTVTMAGIGGWMGGMLVMLFVLWPGEPAQGQTPVELPQPVVAEVSTNPVVETWVSPPVIESTQTADTQRAIVAGCIGGRLESNANGNVTCVSGTSAARFNDEGEEIGRQMSESFGIHQGENR